MLYFHKPILIRSMLAAGIVQDTLAGEAIEGEGGEEETIFLALEFHSQNTHVGMRIRNRCTYI